MTPTLGPIGPDVSFYQDNNNTPQKIDFSKMKSAGAKYVIIRGGQNSWIDPDFVDNWRMAKEVGLPRGAYWFFDSRYPADKQAEIFASLFANDPPEMEVWLDLEENYGGPYGGVANWKRFIDRFKQLCPNITIGIYTSYGYISGKIPSSESTYFKSMLLWLAWYTAGIEGVEVPYPWTENEWLFWQWGTPAWGIEFGCESVEIDMNYFLGTYTQFEERYNQGGTVSDPYYKVTPNVAGEYRSIRKYANPNINGMKIGQVNANNFGKCSINDAIVYAADVYENTVLRAKAGDKWLHVFEANGAPIDGWIAEIHLGKRYLNVEQIGTTPPPVDNEYPVYSMIRTNLGNVYESTTWIKKTGA